MINSLDQPPLRTKTFFQDPKIHTKTQCCTQNTACRVWTGARWSSSLAGLRLCRGSGTSPRRLCSPHSGMRTSSPTPRVQQCPQVPLQFVLATAWRVISGLSNSVVRSPSSLEPELGTKQPWTRTGYFYSKQNKNLKQLFALFFFPNCRYVQTKQSCLKRLPFVWALITQSQY